MKDLQHIVMEGRNILEEIQLLQIIAQRNPRLRKNT